MTNEDKAKADIKWAESEHGSAVRWKICDPGDPKGFRQDFGGKCFKLQRWVDGKGWWVDVPFNTDEAST